MMTGRGTLNIARALVDHPTLQGYPFEPRSAWLSLLSDAAWAAREKIVDRRSVSLGVGELAASSRFLAERWQWTESRVRRFLQRLQRDGMISIRVDRTGTADQGITVVKIANFETSQSVRTRRTTDAPSDAPSDAPLDAPPQTASDLETEGLFVAANAPDASLDAPSDAGGVSKPTQTINNIKKESKILRFQSRAKGQSAPSSDDLLAWPPDAFDQWYQVYPRKKAPKAARCAFDKLRQSGEVTFADLMAATKRFATAEAARPIAERKFIPYPASWLNDGSYAEEPEVHAATPTGAPIRDPSTFSDADWSARFRQFCSSGEWSGLWGPRPGVHGCKVPPHILGAGAPMNRGQA
jgi:hypothetical protein